MHKTVYYLDGQKKLEGYLAAPSSNECHPSVLLVPTWLNITESIRARANHLCELGYASFVVDIFGSSVEAEPVKPPLEAIKPFLENRKVFRERLRAGLKAFCEQPECSQDNLAAIGFCLGGCGVLELARSGAELKGVVSLHGILDSPFPAKSGEVKAKVLVLHGDQDPIVRFGQVAEFRNEMRSARADWQINTYGDARHSFTGEGISSTTSTEAALHPQSAERAWHATLGFLEEVLRSTDKEPMNNRIKQ